MTIFSQSIGKTTLKRRITCRYMITKSTGYQSFNFIYTIDLFHKNIWNLYLSCWKHYLFADCAKKNKFFVDRYGEKARKKDWWQTIFYAMCSYLSRCFFFVGCDVQFLILTQSSNSKFNCVIRSTTYQSIYLLSVIQKLNRKKNRTKQEFAANMYKCTYMLLLIALTIKDQ